MHAHHHRSYNPTAFSGFSMVPVESVLYISAALIPLMFRSGCHPWIHLYTKLDLIIGAQVCSCVGGWVGWWVDARAGWWMAGWISKQQVVADRVV